MREFVFNLNIIFLILNHFTAFAVFILKRHIMQFNADTSDQYVDQLPENRKEAIGKLRKSIPDYLAVEFVETAGYKMPGYVVPHSIYLKGYHANPKLPFPFIDKASKKKTFYPLSFGNLREYKIAGFIFN